MSDDFDRSLDDGFENSGIRDLSVLSGGLQEKNRISLGVQYGVASVLGVSALGVLMIAGSVSSCEKKERDADVSCSQDGKVATMQSVVGAIGRRATVNYKFNRYGFPERAEVRNGDKVSVIAVANGFDTVFGENVDGIPPGELEHFYFKVNELQIDDEGNAVYMGEILFRAPRAGLGMDPALGLSRRVRESTTFGGKTMDLFHRWPGVEVPFNSCRRMKDTFVPFFSAKPSFPPVVL